jgi:hypothetical protein
MIILHGMASAVRDKYAIQEEQQRKLYFLDYSVYTASTVSLPRFTSHQYTSPQTPIVSSPSRSNTVSASATLHQHPSPHRQHPSRETYKIRNSLIPLKLLSSKLPHLPPRILIRDASRAPQNLSPKGQHSSPLEKLCHIVS